MIFNRIKKFLNSIALVPLSLALAFLVLAIILSYVEIEYENIEFFNFISIRNKEDTKFILSFIIGGIFTLTVFSYTMVMNVLNSNINNYSPRLVPFLLNQKHHQLILGFNTGTIVFALMMSLSLNNDEQDYFPAIAGGVGIIFTFISIMLFIYFLQSVSQSVHINNIIRSVYDLTENNIDELKKVIDNSEKTKPEREYSYENHSSKCGYFRLPNYNDIAKKLKNDDVHLVFHKFPGEFIYKGDLLYSMSEKPSDKIRKYIQRNIMVDKEVTLDVVETGFKHLTEVAIKTSSPALNDPGTSLAAIEYLTQLIILRLELLPNEEIVHYTANRVNFKLQGMREILNVIFVELNRYCKDDPVLELQMQKSLALINDKAQFKTEITLPESLVN